MAEIKGVFNFLVATLFPAAMYLNIKLLLLGDDVNKFLTLAMSFLAIISLIVFIFIRVEVLREKRRENRIAEIEFKLKYGDKKKKNDP